MVEDGWRGETETGEDGDGGVTEARGGDDSEGGFGRSARYRRWQNDRSGMIGIGIRTAKGECHGGGTLSGGRCNDEDEGIASNIASCVSIGSFASHVHVPEYAPGYNIPHIRNPPPEVSSPLLSRSATVCT